MDTLQLLLGAVMIAAMSAFTDGRDAGPMLADIATAAACALALTTATLGARGPARSSAAAG